MSEGIAKKLGGCARVKEHRPRRLNNDPDAPLGGGILIWGVRGGIGELDAFLSAVGLEAAVCEDLITISVEAGYHSLLPLIGLQSRHKRSELIEEIGSPAQEEKKHEEGKVVGQEAAHSLSAPCSDP